MTDIEASIDYPEYDVEEVTNEKAIQKLDEAEAKLKKLEESFKTGKIIREGIKTAIIGKPNAGKSSLLNAILKEERAIVTEYAGTTRDTIEEFITIKGIPLKIIDTAGIRDAKDEVEKIGIIKSKKIAENSDLVIAIFDASKELTEEDKEILELIKNKNAIILLNKIDLGKKVINEQSLKQYNKKIIEISALKKQGIEELYEEISRMFNISQININDGVTITNIRHLELVKKAKMYCQKAKETIKAQMPIDICAIDIKEIIESLNSITGENATEDIINEIFKKFCLGK